MSDVIAADQLRLFIERIERLEEEKKGLNDDIKDVYAELKSNGFDVKTVRECVKLRKMEQHVRDEAEMLLDTYKAALGLDYSSTPLGEATVRRAAATGGVTKRDAAEQREATPPAEDESQYQTALALVVRNKKASTSWLQRQMALGYNSAARLIDRMAREGLVSGPDNAGARRVLVDELDDASRKSVLAQVAAAVNAGALGPGVTASVN